jgi:DNA helicase-2/ATP-dependent DNA helicase PcrA
MEQQIFDHLPGIGPERVVAIRDALTPLEIDLGAQNHRSGGTEIATFGQDILLGRVRGAPYAGVSSVRYDPRRREANSVLRMALGMIHRAIRTATGQYARSVAILTHSGASAARISASLSSGTKPVRHKLSFDEAEAVLTARFAAFLLEPKAEATRNEDLAVAMELLATSKAAVGLAVANQWRVWAARVREGRQPRAEFVRSVATILDTVRQHAFTGDPAKDWTWVRRLLRNQVMRTSLLRLRIWTT